VAVAVVVQLDKMLHQAFQVQVVTVLLHLSVVHQLLMLAVVAVLYLPQLLQVQVALAEQVAVVQE
jgi:hypothetical protein